MLEQTKKFLKDEEGAAAVEYALLIGLIAVAVISALVILGPKVAGMFTKVSDALPA